MQRGHRAAGQRRLAEKPDSDGTREKLLEAAAEVFAEAGYYGATVRLICARAGANIALVNYHFGDKLGLYTEVLQQSVRTGHVDAIRAALDQKGTPEEILRGVVRARMRGIAAGGLVDQQFRIMIHELAQPTPAMARVVNNIARPIYKRMLELIGGIIGLDSHDEKTRLCVHSVMGQIMLYVLARPFLMRLWPELKMTPEQLDRIADHIADFSLAYLRQTGLKNERRRGRRKDPDDDTAGDKRYQRGKN
jgi:AcrR family transcriptional regulator